MTQNASPTTTSHPTYHVGTYAVVLHNRKVLLLEYASGQAGLPGALHRDPGASVEDVLRRAIFDQAGVAVDDFRLLGSHAFTNAAGTPQLNLVFSTNYVSGLLGGHSALVHQLQWLTLPEIMWHPNATDLTLDSVRRALVNIMGDPRRKR